MPDKRCQHFWDLWRFGSRTFSSQLGLPLEETWDMVVVYRPNLTWRSPLPMPTAWLQNRALEFGTPYSLEALEAELKRWLN
jgi:hypothetical protein